MGLFVWLLVVDFVDLVDSGSSGRREWIWWILVYAALCVIDGGGFGGFSVF